MLPRAVILRNYRAFAGTHRIELRPLTMLYGDNNAGKSALLRALPLIADSVAPDATGALRLESMATYKSGFHDLIWKGDTDDDSDPDLGIGLEWDPGSSVRAVEYTLVRRDRRILIRSCVIRDDSQEFTLEWVPGIPDAHQYDCRNSETRASLRADVEFRGLVPERFAQSMPGILASLRTQLRGLRGCTQWLQAKRQAPDRRLTIPSGPPHRMNSDGRDAAQVLFSHPSLRAEVSRWYEGAIGRALELVESPPDEFRTTLRNARHSQPFEVDLLDSGQGCIQVLPVLVALALVGLEGETSPSTIAIEEPESHLQGKLQLELADAICSRVAHAKQSDNLRIVIETHSQHMLLGVQLALLKGIIHPDDVVIHWVRQDEHGASHAEPVTLDAQAHLQGHWPDPFATVRDAARRVILARNDRGDA